MRVITDRAAPARLPGAAMVPEPICDRGAKRVGRARLGFLRTLFGKLGGGFEARADHRNMSGPARVRVGVGGDDQNSGIGEALRLGGIRDRLPAVTRALLPQPRHLRSEEHTSELQSPYVI